LRNMGSAQQVTPHGMLVRDLQPDPVAAPTEAPRAPAAPRVEIVRGTETTPYTVTHEGGSVSAPAKPRESRAPSAQSPLRSSMSSEIAQPVQVARQ